MDRKIKPKGEICPGIVSLGSLISEPAQAQTPHNSVHYQRPVRAEGGANSKWKLAVNGTFTIGY